MKNFVTKKKITLILAIVSVLALALGSFAFFTDRETGGALFKTASADKIINISTKDDGTESANPGADLEDEWMKQNVAKPDDPDAPAPVAPGSAFDLNYKLTNLGEDTDIRETIILTVVNYKDDAITLDSDDPAWRLFSGFTKDGNGAKTGSGEISVEKIHYDEKVNQIKYEIAPYVLSKGSSKDLAYQLILNKFAGNEYQASTCKVELLIEARQHVDGTPNNYEDWQEICTSKIEFGGNSVYPVVPAN